MWWGRAHISELDIGVVMRGNMEKRRGGTWMGQLWAPVGRKSLLKLN